MMAPWLFYWAANCIGRLISSFVSSQPSQLEPQEEEQEESYLAGQPGNVAPLGDTPCILLGMAWARGKPAFVFHSCISYAFRLTPDSPSSRTGGLTMKEESCTVLTLYYPRQKKLTTCHSLPSLPTVLHSLGIEQLAT